MATAVHRFVWHDLATTDPSAAGAFYTAVLPWRVVPHGGDYAMWQNGARMVGGVTALKGPALAMGAPPHWLAYVGVEDAAATAAKAAALGGSVHVPATPLGEAGHFAVLADPTGATFAVFQPGRGLGDQADPGPGDFSWAELYTGDLDAASGFYTALFGWTTEDTDMGPAGVYRLFANPDMAGLHMGGMCRFPPGMPEHPAWLCYVTVDDLDAAVGRVREHGGTVIMGPMEVPGGDRIAMCMDPQGGAFALHARPDAG